MKKQRVLIALEQLGVGGIETFVLNQVKALHRQGKEVYVIAKKGLYYDQFEKNGAKIIEYEVADSIYCDQKRIEQMCKILKDNKIDEVHINQFPFMNVLMPACVLTNTPYVAYLHMAAGIIDDPVHNTYTYFETQYITYNKLFKMFFEYATKIVAITDAIKDHTSKRYGVDKSKIIVRPNAIDLIDYSTNLKVKEIKNILLISRLSAEKTVSVTNALKLYQELKKHDLEIKLTIAGDGNIKKDMEDYVKDNLISDVTFLGNISNVKEVMENFDLIIGVDRCILEALSLRKLAVISGYDDMKGLVTKKNIDSCVKENFCGINQSKQSIEKVANELIKLDKDKINTITEENLKVIKDKLDINKNVFYLGDVKANYNYEKFIVDLFEISEIIGKSQIEYYQKAEEIWKQYKSYESYINKRYGFLEKIMNFLRKIKSFIKRVFKIK